MLSSTVGAIIMSTTRREASDKPLHGSLESVRVGKVVVDDRRERIDFLERAVAGLRDRVHLLEEDIKMLKNVRSRNETH